MCCADLSRVPAPQMMVKWSPSQGEVLSLVNIAVAFKSMHHMSMHQMHCPPTRLCHVTCCPSPRFDTLDAVLRDQDAPHMAVP